MYNTKQKYDEIRNQIKNMVEDYYQYCSTDTVVLTDVLCRIYTWFGRSGLVDGQFNIDEYFSFIAPMSFVSNDELSSMIDFVYTLRYHR